MWAKSVLQLSPAVFISCVNDCPACSDTVMLSDRLIYLLVSLPQVPPPFSSYLKAFRSCLIFLFFNLNLNSPLDSAARQNKLFKSFNEEVQSTDSGVQTHLDRRWLTSYRCAGRCACLCVFEGMGECVTGLTHTAGFLKTYIDTDALGVKLPKYYKGIFIFSLPS